MRKGARRCNGGLAHEWIVPSGFTAYELDGHPAPALVQRVEVEVMSEVMMKGKQAAPFSLKSHVKLLSGDRVGYRPTSSKHCTECFEA
jgi:hypothetical protein